MSALTSMPAHVVLPLASYGLAELRRAAERADQRWIHADCSGADDRAGVMAAIAGAADFPDWFGGNLDALRDSVSDLQPDPSARQPGIVFVLEGLPESPGFARAAREALLDVFRDAAEEFYDRDVAFRVFYSVRPSGLAD